jgi:hypothetical protein
VVKYQCSKVVEPIELFFGLFQKTLLSAIVFDKNTDSIHSPLILQAELVLQLQNSQMA